MSLEGALQSGQGWETWPNLLVVVHAYSQVFKMLVEVQGLHVCVMLRKSRRACCVEVGRCSSGKKRFQRCSSRACTSILCRRGVSNCVSCFCRWVCCGILKISMIFLF